MNVIQKFARDFPGWASMTIQELAKSGEQPTTTQYLRLLDAIRSVQEDCLLRADGIEEIAVRRDEWVLHWQALEALAEELYEEVEEHEKRSRD